MSGKTREESIRTDPPAAARSRLAELSLLCAAFTTIALAIYWPALGGGFVSDDLGYIVSNPYIQTLSFENLRAILDPWGEPALYTINYAPLHLLAHAVEWSVFGASTTGYHVINVVLHALTATLLVAFFASRGLPAVASALAGLVFLVHPANVEAVAWIFQLKTIGALALSLGALLAFPGRPLLALILYALALLTKAQALYALPVVAVLVWCGRDETDPWRRHGLWLLGWGLVSLLYAYPEFFAFDRLGRSDASVDANPWVQWRTIGAIGTRYLILAATSYGASAFHEPARALSWLDPLWLGSLVLGALLAGRCLWCLAQRNAEAAFWVWAGAAWLPISQIFPFLFPMADRYLYFILPGLLGALILLGRSLAPGLLARLRRSFGPARALLPAPFGVPRIVTAAVLVLCVVFGIRSTARARIWQSDLTLMLDSARNYPDGSSAHQLRARRAAQRGDADGAARELRGAVDRGWDRFMDLQNDPGLAPVLRSEPMQQLLREMAASWIERSVAMPSPAQADLRVRAMAYLARDELVEAIDAMQEALRLGGPLDDTVRRELGSLEAERKRRAARREGALP